MDNNGNMNQNNDIDTLADNSNLSGIVSSTNSDGEGAYRARSNKDIHTQKSVEANKKVSKMATQAVANYFAGPVGGKVVKAVNNTKIGDKINEKIGQKMNDVTKRTFAGRAAQNAVNKLDESGALDKGQEAMDAMSGGGKGKSPVNNKVKQNKTPQKMNFETKPKNSMIETSKEKKDALKRKKIVQFIIAHPWILVVVFFLLLILILLGLFLSNDPDGANGYFSLVCNFNASSVKLTTCNTDTSNTISLEDYVIGTTYSLTKGKSYSDDVIKAIMIVVKTNAYSYGEYVNNSEFISLDDCIYDYSSDVPDSVKSSYESLYSSISDYLYISSSSTNAVSNLSSSSALNIDESVIKEMSNLDMDYEEILKSIYSKDDTDEETTNSSQELRSTIFLGDSRTEGMMYYTDLTGSNTIYGNSCGYQWLIGSGSFSSSKTNSTSGGIAGVNSKIISGKNYNIVIWLGINDLYNLNNYYNKYYELATGEWSNHTIYIVSVGPVTRPSSITSTEIGNFNNTMKSSIAASGLSNLKFIDVNYNITSYDSEGIHYGPDDYKNIYSAIQSNLDNSLNGDYVLYSMSSSCTYYNVTQNSLYWWPIGSAEPTSGNIYGGDPTTTIITSYFGPRVVDGQNGNHGAIDIGANCGEVVIAAKDGTVTTTSNSCDNNGDYGNPCGGFLGNYVYITHDDGTVSLYGHLYPDSITVSVGDTVVQGQKIGLVGNSGSSTGCHLHFGIKVNNSNVDPLEYVDPSNPRPVLSQVNNIIAGTNEGGMQNVCNALLDSGFSNNAVAGIMVNIRAESNFDTAAVEYDSGHTLNDIYYVSANEAAGFGLIQWSFDRRISMINYANSKGLSPTSLQAQLEYFLYELNNNYYITRKYVYGNYSAYEVALNFCLDFESPANENYTCPNRAGEYANQYLEYVNNGCSW